MTTVVYAVTTNPPAPDLMVKRLFTVAAILSRQPTSADSSEFLVENWAEKHEEEEIGYSETKDQLSNG